MKKMFLTLVAVAMSTAMFAQLQKVERGEASNWVQQPSAMIFKTATLTANDVPSTRAQQRSRGTELYYYKPAGTLYEAIKSNGWGYPSCTILTLPPFQLFTFKNMSAYPTTTRWFENETEYTAYADEDGSLSQYLYPDDIWYYCPTLYNSTKTQSYIMEGHNNSGNLDAVLVARTEMEWQSFYDDKTGYIGGILDNGHTMGTGKYTDVDGDYATPGTVLTSTGVIMPCPAPASPLYVDSTYVLVASHNTVPLKNGAELTLKIYDGEKFDIKDRSTWKLIDTLTATADDYYEWGGDNRAETGYDYVYYGVLSFNKMVDDPIFGKMSQPYTIDKSVVFVIDDFADNDDIDFCPWLYNSYDCDGDLEPAYLQLYDPTEDDYVNIHYYVSADNGDAMPVGMKVALHSIMDYIAVEDTLSFIDGSLYDGFSILRVPEEGGSVCHNYGYENTGYDLGALYVETACPWYDENDNDNYYAENAPDWVSGTIVETDNWDLDAMTYVNWVYFDVEPLPSGETGRYAVFPLVGRGVKARNWVALIQGDAQIPEGIEEIIAATPGKAQSGTYSIAGQRVSDNTKGIVIKEGRKVLNK